MRLKPSFALLTLTLSALLPVVKAQAESTALWSLEGHRQNVVAVAFSTDGKLLATAGDDPHIILWDLAAGKEVTRLTDTGMKSVRQLAFAGDGKTLMAYDSGLKVRVFDTTAKALAKTITLDAPFGGMPVLSSDGKRFALSNIVSNKVELQLWDIGTGKKIAAVPLETNGNTQVLAFSPDGKRLAVVFNPNQTNFTKLRLLDGETGKPLGEIAGEPRQYFRGLAFSSDSKTVAVGADLVRLYNVENQQLLATAANDKNTVLGGIPEWISYSSDGKSLVWGRENIVWADPKTAKSLHVVSGDLSHPIRAISPDHKLAAAVVGGRKVVVTGLTPGATGKLIVTGGKAVSSLEAGVDAKGILTITGNNDLVRSVAVSADGKTIYSLAYDGMLAAWAADTGKQLWKADKKISANTAQSLFLLDGGKTLMAGMSGDQFDAATGKQGAKFDYLNGNEVASDGKMLAVIVIPDPSKYLIQFYQAGKPKPVKSIAATNRPRSLAMSADGKWVAWLEYNKVRVLSAADGAVKAEIDVDDSMGLAFSPDGKMIAVGAAQNLYLYEIESKKKLWSVKHFMAERILFSPDGKVLLASRPGGQPEVVVVRDAATGKGIGQISETGRTPGMTFTPDGKKIIVPQMDQIRVVPIEAIEPTKF